ncbi:pyridoxamine 5'-phosphate oxidase, partial [Acinetobacter baumannii]
MSAGAPVGLLGIEMHTRRRNRMNGVLAPLADGWRVQVDQSFGNCPRYIQQRELQPAGSPSAEADEGLPAPQVLDRLDDDAIDRVRRADTLFIATHHSDPDAP